ncbi:phosphotransferase family protein [Alicyclobacillus sp. ALC3]|uniref:phosphotransferase family protein n=1 Tax=Alicyclobacillus sp. ALC3 TaxID=2796143 RepID=UPI002378D7D7|nr:aminoglycoside phosphotransferase family protein [Alicyclobacillus sp. ALC3]WDL95925.1 aminoglycoside phosphotransferase family protein [Alicyclobacillus sp. ALC3]
MPKHIYLQPDAPDPIHSNEVVLTIVRKHVPDVKSVTSIDESGGEARTYTVDSDIILKVQRPQQLRPLTSLEKEAFFLKQLSLDEQISVPKVLGYGREGTIEYTVMTRVPGVAIVNTTLDGDARKATLFKLGQTLRHIHSVPQEPFRESGLFPGETSFAEVKAGFQESFEELIERITNKRVEWALPYTPEQVAEKSLAALPQSEDHVALHSNPGPTHTFVDKSTGLFTGLIDFGDAYFSHPALDLWRWNLPDDRQAVLAGYTAEKAVDDAFLGTWEVVMILSDMMAIAYQTEFSLESAADLKSLLEHL